jgi:hypothetical protein
VEPTKVIIFIGFFALFLLIMRRFFGTDKPYDPNIPPQPYPGPTEELTNESQPVLTGAEIPFPIQLPPTSRRHDGTFNRPDVMNYYFRKTDLVRGPEDPTSFCDQFVIQFRSPDTGHEWYREYTIATPAGLQKLLETDKDKSVLFDDDVIVIRTWNMAVILETVMDDIIDQWAAPDSHVHEFIFDPGKLPEMQ